MFDILLDRNGDILVSDTGDISLTESVRQAVLIRLRWIYDEWRLGPELGFPWFEEVWVKNPNIIKLKQLIRNEIMEVEGVTDATVDDIIFDKQKRNAKVMFSFSVAEEKFREEVIWSV